MELELLPKQTHKTKQNKSLKCFLKRSSSVSFSVLNIFVSHIVMEMPRSRLRGLRLLADYVIVYFYVGSCFATQCVCVYVCARARVCVCTILGNDLSSVYGAKSCSHQSQAAAAWSCFRFTKYARLCDMYPPPEQCACASCQLLLTHARFMQLR